MILHSMNASHSSYKRADLGSTSLKTPTPFRGQTTVNDHSICTTIISNRGWIALCWLIQNAASTRLEELNVMRGLMTIRNCGRDPAFSAAQVSLIPSTVLSSAEIPSDLPLPRRKHFAMDSRERSPRKSPVYPAGMDWIGSLTKNLPPCPVDPD